jgi:predicted Zn-dependent peptidase
MLSRIIPAGVSALLIVSALAQEEPLRLRTLLHNGATLLVENMPRAKVASVQLFASSLKVPDSPENHGLKHLLEHLILKGQNKDLDLKMESQGMFFTGRTLRDAMQIEVTCAPEQIPLAIDFLKEILKPVNIKPQDITNEVRVMKQEQALQSDPDRLGTAEWMIAYSERGIDPFGDLQVMVNATPDSVQKFQSQLFAADNLVLVVDGPLDVEKATKQGKDFLSSCTGKTESVPDPRPAGTPGRFELENAFGEARAARVGGFKDEKTAWALAAALALASQVKQVFVTYTPSSDNGLVILGQTNANSGMGLLIDGLQPGDMSALYPLGKALAKRWIERQLEDPSLNAYLRGVLLCQGANYKPEEFLSNIDQMTWQDFFKGVELFDKNHCDIVVGIR